MKELGVTLILLLTMFSVAGCAVGPCVGYGCPAFTSAAAPQPSAKNAQNRQVSRGKAQAHNDRPTAPSGQ